MAEIQTKLPRDFLSLGEIPNISIYEEKKYSPGQNKSALSGIFQKKVFVFSPLLLEDKDGYAMLNK